MLMTYKKYVHEAYTISDDGLIKITCANCNESIWTEDLVTPCHYGMAEGSGHGGYLGMSIYCVPNEPVLDKDGNLSAYCGWGGPLVEFEPLLLCSNCHGNPYEKEEE